MTITQITVRITDDIPSVVTPVPPMVNQNDRYELIVEHDGSYDGGKAYDMVRHFTDGTELATTRESYYGDDIILPVMRGVYLLEVSIRTLDGTAKTKQPVLLRWQESILDGDYAEDAPVFDVYNNVMEYLATRDETILEALTAHEVPPAYPGAAYAMAIRQMGRVTELQAKVTKGDNRPFYLTGDDIPQNAAQIACSAVTDDFLLPGGTPSAELAMSVNTVATPTRFESAEIELTFRIQRANEHWCEIPLGTFTAAGLEEQDGNRLSITAYDDMKRLDYIKTEDMGFEDGAAYTAQEIIAACAEAADIDYEDDVSDMTNGSMKYFAAQTVATIATARDLLGFAAQTVCSIAIVDRWRKLRILPIEKLSADETVAPARRMSSRALHLQYRLYRLSTVLTMVSDDGTADVTDWTAQTLWTDGVDANLPENPLWGCVSAANPTTAAQNGLAAIAAALDPVTLYPSETAYPGDPSLELLDWKQLADGRAFPMTDYVWLFHGLESIRSCGFEAVVGVARERSEKAALAARLTSASATENAMRAMYLRAMSTYVGMEGFTHRDLSHFTYKEIERR